MHIPFAYDDSWIAGKFRIQYSKNLKVGGTFSSGQTVPFKALNML